MTNPPPSATMTRIPPAPPPLRGAFCPQVGVPVKAELNAKGALVLSSIVHSFNAPINEEQCWALCHQASKCAQWVLGQVGPSHGGPHAQDIYLTTEMNHILIHKDGTVHPDTFLDPLGSSADNPKALPRMKSSEESKLISNLGVVIFRALDFGFTEDEERHMSPDLEALLDSMTSAEESAERPETDDEGIERDSGDSNDSDDDPGSGNNHNNNNGNSSSSHRNHFDFGRIIEICSRRLGHNGTNESDAHYKAVCRAYVMEALELSSFLQKVSKGKAARNKQNNSNSDPELDKLNFTDWARLWVQVIRDLRQGVKLKKVEYIPGPPIEYELTPYEILMDDIRSRRYKLNKVMVDGNLPPRIKKDAHAIILEFIRSRPPLKKAAERILGPAPQREATPIEKLMQAIRQEPRKLNKTPVRRRESFRTTSRRFKSATDLSGGMSSESTNQSQSAVENNNKLSTPSNNVTTVVMETKSQPPPPQRKLIKVDLDLIYGNHDSKDDDDDYDFSDSETNSPHRETGVTGFFGHICPEGSQSTPVSPWKKSPADEFHHHRGPTSNVDIRRRHSICNPTVRSDHATTLITFPFEYTNAENVFSSLAKSKYPTASPIFQRRSAELPRSMSKSSLQEEFLQSNHWATAMECLSLNLEEVVHIRNVLTKAELESLPLDCSLKEDVEKGKVCFLCLKTRFSLIFGPWGNTCKLCKRTVCTKCCSKMRIPTEQFANVPVSTLSPNISPRDEDKDFLGPSLTAPHSGGSKSLTPTNSLSHQHHNSSAESLRRSSSGCGSHKSIASTNSNTSQHGSEPMDRSLSPGGHLEDDPDHDHEESRDQFGPEHGSYMASISSGPRSLPTVQSISLGLMAFKRRNFGRENKTDRQSLMVVCHDCRAMVLQIIKSSRAKSKLQQVAAAAAAASTTSLGRPGNLQIPVAY